MTHLTGKDKARLDEHTKHQNEMRMLKRTIDGHKFTIREQQRRIEKLESDLRECAGIADELEKSPFLRKQAQ